MDIIPTDVREKKNLYYQRLVAEFWLTRNVSLGDVSHRFNVNLNLSMFTKRMSN